MGIDDMSYLQVMFTPSSRPKQLKGLTVRSDSELFFKNLRNTNKDGTASTATGDQIAPKGYQREDHLDG